MASPTCTSSRGSNLKAYATAGAFVGHVAAVFIICAAIFCLRWRRPRAQSAASISDDVHHPQMETWKPPLERTSVDTLTLTEMLTAMTKPYVRVFTPCIALPGGRVMGRWAPIPARVRYLQVRVRCLRHWGLWALTLLSHFLTEIPHSGLRTRNSHSDILILTITPITEVRRQQGITNTSS